MKKIIITLSVILICQYAYCQASLAAEDIIDDISVTTASGVKTSYTLLRDAVEKNQWYYMPSQSRLYEIQASGNSKPEPEFTFIKYQYNDPKNHGQLLEGGVLQFAIVMSPDNAAMDYLRNVIKQRTNNVDVRLAGLPLKQARVTLVTPKGEFVAEGSQTEGIAPLMANQKMVFSLALTKMGTDIYDALVNSNTGMGVAVNFSYNGLTPPAGFKITVNWDESYKFFSKNEVSRASVGGMLSWASGSAEYKSEKQRIFQELKENKCIKVEATTGENFSDSMAYKYIDPILQKITTELFTTDAFSKRMDSMLVAASLQKDTIKPDKSILNFLHVSAGKSIAVKDVTLVKKGTETVEFNIKQLVERKSMAGGFVGLGQYSAEIKKKLAIVVAGGNWESAFFILPPVSDDEEIGIKQVGMEIKLKNKEKYYSSQAFNWTKETGWTDKDGQKRTVAAFPLLELKRDDLEMKNVLFETRASLNIGNDVVDVTQQVKAGNSENNVAVPLSLVDVIKVEPDLLSFNKLVPNAKLDYVTINLTDGERVGRATIKPRSVNGTPAQPKPFYWLTSKNNTSSNPVKATIVFALHDGTNINWKNNNKNLGASDIGYDIVLRDIDYSATVQ